MAGARCPPLAADAPMTRLTERPPMPPRRESPEVTLLAPASETDLRDAAELGLCLATARDPSGWQLVREASGLHLQGPVSEGALALELRTTQGPLALRLRTARRDEPLPRAIGLHRPKVPPPTVVDATAGLCRDAMVLASMGCRVTAIERVPALVLLVRDALRGSGFADRLQVLAGDAVGFLLDRATAGPPDVVYLDPMFAAPGTAQVKKDMQVLRALAGPPDDPAALFAAARTAARERVVVKRHHGEAPLAPGVSFAVAGERVRFDVYLRTGG